jgi:CubicO group peptidase (beta-lactamase class C family)
MKSKMLKYSILIILAAVIGCSATQNEKTKGKQISHLMNYCYQNEIFNGTILVADKGKIVFREAFGVTNYDYKTQLNINTMFSLASISKTFTSTAILMLIEDGRLKFSDKLSHFFPSYPNGDKISVYQLLTHTSGVPGYLDFGGYFRVHGRPGDFMDSVTNERAFNYLSSIDTLLFKPGTKFRYSNSGYFLLSQIIEKASGKPYYEFMNESIFQPLNMSNTRVVNDPSFISENRACGFTDFKQPDDDNLLTTGGGGIYSTVDDLFQWDRGLISGRLLTDTMLIKAFMITKLVDGSYRESPTDSTTSYGMGWVFRTTQNDSIVWHDGGLNACTSILYRDLKNDFTIIMLSNKGSSLPIPPIFDEVVKIMNNEPYSLPDIPISLKLKSLIKEFGIEKAIDSCRVIKKEFANSYIFSPNQLNSLGYYYIGYKEYNIANAVLGLNIEIYPENSNAYDSYAESLYLLGELPDALINYRISVEMNPDNQNGIMMINKIEDKLSIIPQIGISSMDWLYGKWKGSNSEIVFYEEYRYLNDTTIEMLFYDSDSTFTNQKNHGLMYKVNDDLVYIYNDRMIWKSSLKNPFLLNFAPYKNASNNFKWEYVNDNHWKAIMENNTYDLKRYK